MIELVLSCSEINYNPLARMITKYYTYLVTLKVESLSLTNQTSPAAIATFLVKQKHCPLSFFSPDQIQADWVWVPSPECQILHNESFKFLFPTYFLIHVPDPMSETVQALVNFNFGALNMALRSRPTRHWQQKSKIPTKIMFEEYHVNGSLITFQAISF